MKSKVSRVLLSAAIPAVSVTVGALLGGLPMEEVLNNTFLFGLYGLAAIVIYANPLLHQ